MVRELHVISGPDKGKMFLLQEGAPLLFGRSRHAETRLSDLHVSRVHCEIELEDGQVLVTDLDSGGGTFVNAKRVTEAYLRNGDVLQIGETQIRVQGVQDEVADAPTIGGVLPPKSVALTPEKLHEMSGRTLSHFHVGKVLAKGQTGLVFQARDFKDDREVALKVLYPTLSANNKEKRRFVRSAKTMVGLRHPNLVAFRGAGKTSHYCWLAMEYIEGESLSQVIQRIGVAGMLDWRVAYRVAVHVARALEYAHGHQVVHRNITPQNVMIQTGDKVAKLGDLMLAKAMEGQLAEQITRPGELLGDLRYMSPERTYGTKTLDARSDLYGLGALVYALLTGRPPFDGATLVDKITRIRTAEPEKPAKYQMSIPDLFQGVVLKLLAKEPGARHQSATELLKDLERVGKFQNLPV